MGKRGADEAGRLARAGSTPTGVEVVGPSRAGTASSAPSWRRTGSARWRPTAARRPSSVRRRSTRRGSTAAAISSSRATRCIREPVAGAALRAVELRPRREPRSASTSPRGSRSGMPGRRFREAVEALAPRRRVRERGRGARSAAGRCRAAWIVKRGARGCSFAGDERAALPVERVVDSTGAGDALAAGWIVGGPDLALEAAARCVARREARVDAVSELIVVSDEVRAALADGTPVVALETTLVAHGFPAPVGVEVGIESDEAVRAAGAIPATTGSSTEDPRRPRAGPAGALHAGSAQARAARPRGVRRAGRDGGDDGRRRARARAGRDPLPGTGGIGGVHRGFPSPPDVSADVAALARRKRS